MKMLTTWHAHLVLGLEHVGVLGQAVVEVRGATLGHTEDVVEGDAAQGLALGANVVETMIKKVMGMSGRLPVELERRISRVK